MSILIHNHQRLSVFFSCPTSYYPLLQNDYLNTKYYNLTILLHSPYFYLLQNKNIQREISHLVMVYLPCIHTFQLPCYFSVNKGYHSENIFSIYFLDSFPSCFTSDLFESSKFLPTESFLSLLEHVQVSPNYKQTNKKPQKNKQ